MAINWDDKPDGAGLAGQSPAIVRGGLSRRFRRRNNTGFLRSDRLGSDPRLYGRLRRSQPEGLRRLDGSRAAAVSAARICINVVGLAKDFRARHSDSGSGAGQRGGMAWHDAVRGTDCLAEIQSYLARAWGLLRPDRQRGRVLQERLILTGWRASPKKTANTHVAVIPL